MSAACGVGRFAGVEVGLAYWPDAAIRRYKELNYRRFLRKGDWKELVRRFGLSTNLIENPACGREPAMKTKAGH